ncbi:MAG: hypothetical protein U0175_05325 [Caldilineaceae bacterium]
MTAIERELDEVGYILTLLLNEPKMEHLLANCGYGREQLQEGFTLYEKARSLSHVREESRQTKAELAEEFVQAWKIARLHYTLDLRLARLAVGEERSLRTIFPAKRRSKRKISFYSWQDDAETFYNNLQKSTVHQVLLAKHGLSPVRIADSVRAVQRASQAYSQQFKQEARAETLMQERNNTMQFLRQWTRILRVVMRTAFKNEPHLLIAVGLRYPPIEET